MIRVKKNTIYLYDELRQMRYLIYKNHIIDILLENYPTIDDIDLLMHRIIINCDDGSKYYIMIDNDVVLLNIFNIPISERYSDKFFEYKLKLEDYIQKYGVDKIENISFQVSEKIKELFEKITNGDEDFEYDTSKFLIHKGEKND